MEPLLAYVTLNPFIDDLATFLFIYCKVVNQTQPSQLGKKFDSKFLSSIFASSKAFRRQEFSCLFLPAARVHD